MFAFIGSMVQSVIGGVLSPLFTYLNKKQDVGLEQFKAASAQERDEYLAYTQALAQANQAKVQNNTSGVAHFMVYLFGVPAALHWGAVFVVSTFPALYKGGSYEFIVAALPPTYASAELTIALSFFILAPTLPLVSAAAAMINRK